MTLHIMPTEILIPEEKRALLAQISYTSHVFISFYVPAAYSSARNYTARHTFFTDFLSFLTFYVQIFFTHTVTVFVQTTARNSKCSSRFSISVQSVPKSRAESSKKF
ncbi:hypothetical protein J3Q64DRAFT_1704736 [Phycomyces blakesleeanus]|uniref:Uncharacterized protein n=2 Tax=Phycomyces blakesleeanus TaxID=4837 RepID=A0A163CS81_PHYB8|nr:hypothetical protein PHYBLDRAFT_72587 [Phycomyces blakesleeanus NRRL 1555(-)]OAD65230.1 hypothetical protein PHYBLDRAFT_72587 [Phycomyces blakesleeanus NRRL 1555(-)]|eukprot:XP_018283270.1 hypothetical protein PHYBLDRAFT_72587 [Phycomyces blakesleeanus NRRL 1555(-)]